MQVFNRNKKQAGVTLLELIAGLAVMSLIIVGALSLHTGASSSQAGNQMTSDLVALRAATKTLYQAAGSYGANGDNIASLLNSAKKAPTTLTWDTTNSRFNHRLNGYITIVTTGAGSTFTATVNNVPNDVCVTLLTSAQGWNSVKAGVSAARTTFPISPTAANTDCAAANQDMVFVGQ